MVCELCQLFGEQIGVLREARANAEKTAPVAQNTQPSAKIKQTYVDKLKRANVTVEVQPKAKQTCKVTKKQLADIVDVVGKKIGVRGVKRGKDVAVFEECSSKHDAEKLRITAAEKMEAKARELKKSNLVVCIYRVDDLPAEKVSECVRQQNESVEFLYESAEQMKEDFRFFATPKDKKRSVETAVYSVSPKLRSRLVNCKV
ncbi:hypothetical protein Trydic_g19788 [Trypoxylus dichotomus]